MDVEDSNMLRAAARKCRDEIRQEWGRAKLRPGKDYKAKDAISRLIIRKHAEKLKPKFTLLQLLWQIGVLEGTLKDRD